MSSRARAASFIRPMIIHFTGARSLSQILRCVWTWRDPFGSITTFHSRLNSGFKGRKDLNANIGFVIVRTMFSEASFVLNDSRWHRSVWDSWVLGHALDLKVNNSKNAHPFLLRSVGKGQLVREVEISDLRLSSKTVGKLYPVLLDRDGMLLMEVSSCRRWKLAKDKAWTRRMWKRKASCQTNQQRMPQEGVELWKETYIWRTWQTLFGRRGTTGKTCVSNCSRNRDELQMGDEVPPRWFEGQTRSRRTCFTWT